MSIKPIAEEGCDSSDNVCSSAGAKQPNLVFWILDLLAAVLVDILDDVLASRAPHAVVQLFQQSLLDPYAREVLGNLGGRVRSAAGMNRVWSSRTCSNALPSASVTCPVLIEVQIRKTLLWLPELWPSSPSSLYQVPSTQTTTLRRKLFVEGAM